MNLPRPMMRRWPAWLMLGVLAGTWPALLLAADAPPAAGPTSAPSTASQKTIVTADRLEATNSGVEGQYVFIGNVRITGTNLEITCDRLEIYSVSDTDEPAEGGLSDAGDIRRMLAIGNVAIAQAGRRATCGVAEVLPQEDRIILTEKPVVSDIEMGVTMRGTRMTYHRDEREIEVENPEVIGPALPNLGFPTSTGEAPGAVRPTTPAEEAPAR